MIDANPAPYTAKVLADSCANGVRLTTFVVCMPRIVLAEFNTHRMLSRNSASSRAIPVKKRIETVSRDPYVPLAFGKNRKGMQSTENLDDAESEKARFEWHLALREALARAEALADLGVHRQFANRLLEPFSFHTVIATGTDWRNFFALRISEHAQPEINRCAEAMLMAMNDSIPEHHTAGGLHLPLISDDELVNESFTDRELKKISAARCARVSYLTHDGVRDHSADLALADRLIKNKHMSPFEHVAEVGIMVGSRTRIVDQGIAFPGEYIGNFRAPWIQYRKTLLGEAVHG